MDCLIRGRMNYSLFTISSLVSFFISSISFVVAQEPRIEFERVSITQGLSQSEVNCILRDRQGFMWFGTPDGLNRYDGYTFTVYRHNPPDSHSISANYVTAPASGVCSPPRRRRRSGRQVYFLDLRRCGRGPVRRIAWRRVVPS